MRQSDDDQNEIRRAKKADKDLERRVEKSFNCIDRTLRKCHTTPISWEGMLACLRLSWGKSKNLCRQRPLAQALRILRRGHARPHRSSLLLGKI